MNKEQEIEKQYNSFKESGDLKILFPGMSGTWEKDKRRFTLAYEDNERLLSGVEEFTKPKNN